MGSSCSKQKGVDYTVAYFKRKVFYLSVCDELTESRDVSCVAHYGLVNPRAPARPVSRVGPLTVTSSFGGGGLIVTSFLGGGGYKLMYF